MVRARAERQLAEAAERASAVAESQTGRVVEQSRSGEVAKVGRPLTPTRYTGWLDSTTLYFGGETPVGPLYLGVGYSTRGSANAYLFIGAP